MPPPVRIAGARDRQNWCGGQLRAAAVDLALEVVAADSVRELSSVPSMRVKKSWNFFTEHPPRLATL